jgi:hypothetical protein
MKKFALVLLFVACNTFAMSNAIEFKFSGSGDDLSAATIVKSLESLTSNPSSRLATELNGLDTGWADKASEQLVEAINSDSGVMINRSGCCGGYSYTKAVPVYYAYKGFSKVIGWAYYGLSWGVTPPNFDNETTTLAFGFSNGLNVDMFENGFEY